MLVPRGIRLLAGQCRTSPFHVWFLGARPLAVDRTARVWYVQTPPTSMAAAYSTKRNVFNSLLLISKRMDSTTASKPKIITNPNFNNEPKPLIPNKSIHDTSPIVTTQPPPLVLAPTNVETHSILDDPSKQVPSTEAQKSSPMPPSKPPSFDSRLSPPNIKMPSREQVEQYFFTALVYVWDFCAYVFSLSYRLIDTYVLNNPTLQAYWKKLIKRLDDQRDSIKSKK